MRDKQGNTLLAKFSSAGGFKAAFPGTAHGAWRVDCEEVDRVADELRKRDIPVRIVRISGEKYREYLTNRMISDSPEIREEFAAITAASRQYKVTAAVRAARSKGGQISKRPRAKKRKADSDYDIPEPGKAWLTRREAAVQFLDVGKVVDRIAEYACKFKGAVWLRDGEAEDIEDFFRYIRSNARADMIEHANYSVKALIEYYQNQIDGIPRRPGDGE